MKILVTGGAGYIGSIVSERLLDKHYTVYVLDNLSSGHRDSVPDQAIFSFGDTHNLKTVKENFELFRPDFCIHLASLALVEESLYQEEKYFYENLLGGLNIALMCRKFNVKLIFSSSCSIYGAGKNLTESSYKKPISPYAESKLITEYIIRQLCRESIIMRFFNVGGSTKLRGEQHTPETHLIPLILQAIKNKESFVINGTDYKTSDGTCVRDYLHVLDIGEFILKAIHKFIPGVYNLGTGKGYSILEIIGLCEAVTGEKLEYLEGIRRRGDHPYLVASYDKAKTEFGWRPEKTITNIIEDSWRFINR